MIWKVRRLGERIFVTTGGAVLKIPGLGTRPKQAARPGILS